MILDFGADQRWMLFGGGPILVAAAEHLKRRNVRPLVICGRRHLDDEVSGGLTLERHLRQLEVDLIDCRDVNTDEDVLSRIDAATVGLSFDAPWIFKRDFIDRFGGKLINSHGARLPQDRGGGGFSWRIMRGERLGYSVLHQVLPKVDAGAIVKIDEYLYPTSCRIPQDYFNFTLETDKAFVKTFIDEVLEGSRFPLISQPEYLSFYYPRLSTDAHGFVDWSWRHDSIESFACAFDDPYPGASTFWQDQRVRLKKVFAISNDGAFHPFQSGLIYRKTRDGVFVAANSGALLIREVVGPGKESMMDRLRVGDRFHTPSESLEAARRFRAVYTAQGLAKA